MHAPKNAHLRAAIEIGFIIFLFYSNLLMGEFTVKADQGRTLLSAVQDMVTWKTFVIALVTSVVGHLGFEVLRRKS